MVEGREKREKTRAVSSFSPRKGGEGEDDFVVGTSEGRKPSWRAKAGAKRRGGKRGGTLGR